MQADPPDEEPAPLLTPVEAIFERFVYPVLIPAVVIVGVALGLIGDGLGIEVSIAFFKATAAIFPLLFVAMFVAFANIATRLDQSRRIANRIPAGSGDPAALENLKGMEERLSHQARRMIWLSVIGEAASLYCVGANDRCVIFAGICAMALAALVYLISAIQLTYLGVRATGD